MNNLSRRFWRIDETYTCFYLYSFILSNCPLLYSVFHHYSVTNVVCSYLSYCIHVVHITISYVTLCKLSLNILTLNIWYRFINYLAYCYILLRMNHLTLCSNSNHLWYLLIVLKCKVHVSFITFILEDEHGLSLGMLMHVKCIHELCIILFIFPSYLHHIRVISLIYNDFGNNSQVPLFFWN